VTSDATAFGAAVLVGHATRLPDKFDLVLDGATVLDRVLHSVRRAGLTPTIVAVLGADRKGAEVVVDRYDRGPLGGVRAYLEVRPGPFVLVGGDMPFLQSDDLRRLRERFHPGVSVVPRSPEGTFEVLFALYDVSLEQVTRYWSQGRSLQHLVSDAATGGMVDAVPVSEFDPRSFADLDTPADLERWTQDPLRGSSRESRE
jgi:molybdopterin-guanine dinucleotide biosynthesis protein A